MAADAHGGRLLEACQAFGGEPRDWTDLSTGINPWPYPLPALDGAVWTRLPEPARVAGLEAAARQAYGAPDDAGVVAGPGSQALIQWLPRLVPRTHVTIVGPTYAGHARAWRAGGHSVAQTPSAAEVPDTAQVVIVTNPNNPDGRTVAPAALEALRARLAARQGWLVLDEAYADLSPALSLAPRTGQPGLVVVRSFGKFFGLAGLRLGFAVTTQALAATLREALGAWPVSGAAVQVGVTALGDRDWHERARRRLAGAAGEWRERLAASGVTVVGGTALFTLLEHAQAADAHARLATDRLLVRTFADRPRWLRIGLPPSAAIAARVLDGLAAA